MSLYDKSFSPMLLGKTEKPFDDREYIFELKFDGIRTLIFVESDNITIKNKRNIKLNDRYPELLSIKDNVKKKVIFDGEIVMMVNGKPNFQKLKERALLKNKLRINYYVNNYPVVFIAYDILYEDKDLTQLPLIERKRILKKYKDTSSFIKIKYIEEFGKKFYKIVLKEDLEGIIAKKKDSTYLIGKRSNNWLKIKNLKYEDFYICGYKEEDDINVASLLLGDKKNNKITYIGTVVIGKRNPEYLLIKKMPIDKKVKNNKEGFIHIIPTLECTVEFMEKTKNNKLRQPKYVGLK